ncbi:NAD(P)-dependent oxidoreductase [Sphingomonas morindae]|uniref:NAD(P)-dependent oxidoreductase n=1 Tax=Sphingomonas morindae TaxID=1541170 RepID=A0ABY4XCS8_9SPHN|nr:NAD(P)-dependent oxidoreductase [Sphingomonas morindae]USI74644.1 NAD(P)-dependent oxidoreductase [Sphingomonas morindae]
MQIGIIGLGAMGAPIARNLVKAGHEVRAWNRTPPAPDAMSGLVLLDDPAAAFQAEAVLTVLSDDASIREVVLEPGLVRRARPGLVHVVVSTISVAFAQALAELHAQAGLGYVSAPVLGRPDVAARGALNMLVGGAAAAVARVEPVLAATSQRLWHLGEAPERANAAKLAANMMIAMAIEALAEGAAIAESVDLPRARFFELVLGTLFSGRAYETYSAQITDRAYEPKFRAALGLKDLRLAAEASARTGRTLPMLEAVRARLSEAVAAGLGDKDWSILAELSLESRAPHRLEGGATPPPAATQIPSN